MCVGWDWIPSAGAAENDVAGIRVEHGVRIHGLGHDLVVDLNQGVPDLTEFVERYRLSLEIVTLLVLNGVALLVVGIVVVAALSRCHHEECSQRHHGEHDCEELAALPR